MLYHGLTLVHIDHCHGQILMHAAGHSPPAMQPDTHPSHAEAEAECPRDTGGRRSTVPYPLMHSSGLLPAAASSEPPSGPRSSAPAVGSGPRAALPAAPSSRPFPWLSARPSAPAACDRQCVEAEESLRGHFLAAQSRALQSPLALRSVQQRQTSSTVALLSSCAVLIKEHCHGGAWAPCNDLLLHPRLLLHLAL